jgi:hypothetical protein
MTYEPTILELCCAIHELELAGKKLDNDARFIQLCNEMESSRLLDSIFSDFTVNELN